MTTYLRKVNKPARLTYYDRAVVQKEFGLKEDEYFSDLLDDFSTKNGELSIFEVEPDNPTDILHVLCAIVAKSDHIQATGYLLFDGSVFDNPDIANPVRATEKTASPDVSDRHYNVPAFTTNILTEFTNNVIAIYQDKDAISKRVMKSHLIRFRHDGMLPDMSNGIKKILEIS